MRMRWVASALRLACCRANACADSLRETLNSVLWGVSLWLLSSCPGFGMLIVGAVAEHGEQHVAASSGQADEGGVVLLALGSFLVVVGAAGGVGQGRERGEEERPFEFPVAGSGGVLTADAAAGAVGDRGDAGVGGEVPGGRERRGV